MSRGSTTVLACRSCGDADLRAFLDLGTTPLADGLLRPEDLERPEPAFPLIVSFCAGCGLVQITETVDPELLFKGDYPYYSSVSDALQAHTRANVADLVERRGLSGESLVIELASNDGYLLRHFRERGVPVLGIDPAEGPARAARERGVDTLCEFFTLELARRLRNEGTRADVVIGNNVLAHVADTNGFVAGVAELLREDGVGVFEFPYLGDLIEHCEFDTIYHEHLCYFSLTALVPLFARHGLHLNDLRRIPIHGGSLRIFVEPRLDRSEAVENLLQEERELGMDGFEHYAAFGERVRSIRDELRRLLGELRGSGRLAAYGAAAKGSTLLNYCAIGTETLDFVVDRNPHKHGKLMPGVHLPIHPPEKLLEEQPAHTLILPWNFKDEIRAQQAEYERRGGRFVVPIPWPEVLA